MAVETYWYSQLEAEGKISDDAVAEAKIIVDAFGERKPPIEIGGVLDEAVEDNDLHSGGIAFMYVKGQILARERYLAGTGWTPELPDR